MILDFNPAQIVARAIQQGWVRQPEARDQRSEGMDKRQLASRAWHERKRQEFRRAGLNAQGKPYRPRIPKITGLYRDHAAYMRAWRRMKLETN